MKHLSFLLLIFLLSTCAFGQTKKGDQMTQAELTAYGMKIMNPSDKHELLKQFSGNWEVETEFVMEPGQPPMTFKSSSAGELLMGGRFVEVNTTGTVMGMPIEAMQLFGHDNAREVYTLYGIDGMGTAAVSAEGTYDPETKTLSLHGEEDDPIFYAPRKFKFVHRFIDEDHREYELWFLTNEKGEEAPYRAISSKVSRKQEK